MRMHWSKISLIFLFVVALIGTLLRSSYYIPIPFEYDHLVHAHSHVAFQGWIYTLMFLFLTHLFVGSEQQNKGRYPQQFKLTLFVIIGVLISFSLQGYALYSILFSTLFQLLNYWFFFRFFKDAAKTSSGSQGVVSLLFIKTGLILGAISTWVPFGIGALAAKGMAGTEAYNSLVYTFLHLQYNGWFLFVALGLFYQFLIRDQIHFNFRYAFWFFGLFAAAVLPATALSLLGMSFVELLLPSAYLAAILQVVAIVYFVLSIGPSLQKWLSSKAWWFRFYILAFIGLFTLKVVLQGLSALPMFASMAFQNKPILLAYLHLSLIGVLSFLFLAFLVELKVLTANWLSHVAHISLILGFALTESLLISEGFGLYGHQLLLIAGSMAMALGILLLIFSPSKQIDSHG